MSVYIRGIEMPKSPSEMICVFSDGTAVKYFNAMMEHLEEGKAFPVPDHGDLIDRREAVVDANERAYDFWNRDADVDSTIMFLNEQTTIIPADHADKGDA